MKLHYGDLTDSTNLVKIISEVSGFFYKHSFYLHVTLEEVYGELPVINAVFFLHN